MILSHQHSFLFVKARKVGGTSIEMALSALCRHENDIITPITPIDELARFGMGGQPRNFARDSRDEAAFIQKIRTTSPEKATEIETPPLRFYNHMPLREIAEQVDVASFRIIGVVRSPFGLVVSWANHCASFAEYHRTGQRMSASRNDIQRIVDEEINSGSINRLNQSNMYRDRYGNINIEKIKYSNFRQDFKTFLDTIDKDCNINLPHSKEGLNLSEIDASEMLRKDQIKKIEELFADDINEFGLFV